MTAVIPTSAFDLEISDMKYDPVIVKIFQDTFDSKDRLIGSFVRTLTTISWLKQELRAVTWEDEDSLLAALRVASDMHEYNVSRAESIEDYAEILNDWLVSAQLLEGKLKAIHNKGKTFNRMGGYMKKKIGPSYMDLPREQRKDIFGLLREMHRQESLQIYQPTPQPLKSHFQIGVVTWLKFCGGLPKVIEVLNVPNETDLPMFFTLLAVCTYNDHILQILGETQQTRPGGLTPSDGEWFYQIITGGIPGEMKTLSTEADYLSLKQTTAALYENQKMRMIHEVLTRVPAAIRASRGDDNVTLHGPSISSYAPLPAAFQPSLEDEPLEGGLVSALAKVQTIYQEKDDHAFTMEVAEAIGSGSNEEQIRGTDGEKEASERKRKPDSFKHSRTDENKKKQNSKLGFNRREAKRRKKKHDAEEREFSDEEQLPEVEQLSLEEQLEEEELSSDEQLCNEAQEEQQEQLSQIVLPTDAPTLQFPMRPKAVARGKQRARR